MSLAAKMAVGRSLRREHPRGQLASLVPAVGVQSATRSARGVPAGTRERALVAHETMSAGGEAEGVLELVPEEGNASVAELEQVPRRELAARDVVADHVRQALRPPVHARR